MSHTHLMPTPICAGQCYESLIAIVPIVVGVRLAHQNFIRDHRSTILGMKNLGVSYRFFQRHFTLQALLLALAATACATIVARIIVRPFLSLLFLGLYQPLPQYWGSPLLVLPTSLLTLIVIYVIGVATIRLDKVLEGDVPASAMPKRRVKAASILGWAIAAVTLIGGVWSLFTGGSWQVTALMVFTTPVLAAMLAGPLCRFSGRTLSSLLSKSTGWSSAAVGIRSVTVTQTASRASLAAVLVAIPLIGFTWAQASINAGEFYSEREVEDVPVVLTHNERLMPPADAEAVCDQLGAACHGLVYWQPSDFLTDGDESIERSRASDYTLSASSPQVLDEFLTGEPPFHGDNPFFQDYMQIFVAVSQNPPVNPDWALPVVEDSVSVGEGMRVVSAKQWASHAGHDTQLFFGPNGEGTAGIIALVAYTLLAICVILVTAAVGNRRNLLHFFAPLEVLGRTPASIRWTMVWTVIFPYLCAAIAAAASVLWYCAVAFTVTKGVPGAWLPSMPAGLWVLFAFVFVITSATAFLPEPPESSTDENSRSRALGVDSTP